MFGGQSKSLQLFEYPTVNRSKVWFIAQMWYICNAYVAIGEHYIAVSRF